MSKVDNVIVALNGFVPSDDDADNVHRLYQIFEGFRSCADRAGAIPAIFALLERFPAADFGSPGPLVHELEAMPAYQSQLQESLARQPADLTVWMINRILNTELQAPQRELWSSLLKDAARHPRSPESTVESAVEFLKHQEI